MNVEESGEKKKQEWSLLDLMVDLFDKIEEVVELTKAINTPIPGLKLVNITYLMILRTGAIENPVSSGKI